MTQNDEILDMCIHTTNNMFPIVILTRASSDGAGTQHNQQLTGEKKIQVSLSTNRPNDQFFEAPNQTVHNY